MIHDDVAHDHLGPEDLWHHLPECHGHDPKMLHTRRPSAEEVEAWFGRTGAESTGDLGLDYLVYIHHAQHDEDERPDRVLRLLARVVSGLAVPYSLSLEVHGDPAKVLGTAAEPWRALRVELHLFGWSDADEVEKSLRKALRIEEGD